MRPMKAIVGIIVVLVIIAGCMSLPCLFFERIRDDEVTWAGLHMMPIPLAFHSYYDDHGTLPPAVVRGKNGEPLYSWRVLLLPYLDELELYKQFKLDEPWDSPHNQRFLDTRNPFVYVNDPPGFTHYQVFVGPGTAFERPGLTFKDFPDGLGNTILMVEAREPVPWSKPADLTYDPKGPLPALGSGLSRPTRNFLCYPIDRRPGVLISFGDAHRRYVGLDQEEHVLRGLITRNGGERVTAEDLR